MPASGVWLTIRRACTARPDRSEMLHLDKSSLSMVLLPCRAYAMHNRPRSPMRLALRLRCVSDDICSHNTDIQSLLLNLNTTAVV